MTTTTFSTKNILRIKDLGFIDYKHAYDLQMNEVQNVISGAPNTLFLCEHNPTFTMGRLSSEKNIIFSPDDIHSSGASIIRVDRGGEITFHGPGQLVVYPILKLSEVTKDLKKYMSKLEQVTIDFLKHFGIVGNRVPGYRGVWVGSKKIASIGIGVRKWVSFHGMAINVKTDMSFFKMIKPCGLDVEMTSLCDFVNVSDDMSSVKNVFTKCFCSIFNLNTE